MVLVVLAEDEATPPRAGDPLPVLTAPVAVLPPLAQRWAWAHVEARLDGVTTPDAAHQAVVDGVRSRSPQVVARLLAPRRLAPGRGWLACLVPATAAGRDAGLPPGHPNPPGPDAWPAGGGGTVDLPVYHWWGFRTGEEGDFESLARRLNYTKATALGLGARTVDVSAPWPGDPPAAPVTLTLDGALRPPGPPVQPEQWSDPGAQTTFTERLTHELAAAAARAGDQASAEAPPLYGSHHTGQLTLPTAGWLPELNLQVRRRVAAALGTRYVQVEQEFLMARAWEQVGAVREANRLLAAAELATAAAEQSQRKHVASLAAAARAAELVTVLAPVATELSMDGTATLATALVGSVPVSAAPTEGAPVLAGLAGTAFVRLTRRGGALARRAARQGADPGASVLADGLAEAGITNTLDTLVTALAPVRRQVARLDERIVGLSTPDAARPLAPIMEHPRFPVPMAEELFARWPEWALPGIGGLPRDTVSLLETDPEFVAAFLVGLNHEFNRELLWREYPTDQRGTPFARFWPGPVPDIDEIARWPLDRALSAQVRGGREGSLVMLVRGALLRRFPGTPVLAVKGVNGQVPDDIPDDAIHATPLVLDEETVLYLFSGLDEDTARAGWFLVFREPLHATQFGFDLSPNPPDPTWDDIGVARGGLVPVTRLPGAPADAATVARLAFQRPFQLAFDVAALLKDPP